MSLENITSKILQDAEEIRASIMDEAQVKAEAMLHEATEKAQTIIQDAQDRGEADKAKLIERRRAVSVIDGKKAVLEEKQALISQCFDKAVDSIIAMDESKYVELLANEIAKTGMNSGELVFNEKESKTVAPLVIKKLKEQIPDNTIVLSEETKNVRGGFLLKEKSVYINGTIEAMVDELKDELTGEIATILFE